MQNYMFTRYKYRYYNIVIIYNIIHLYKNTLFKALSVYIMLNSIEITM